MIDRIDGPLVPFRQAEPQTQQDFLAGLLKRGLSGNPPAWQCTVCEERTDGEDILISYNVPTPIPYCPTEIGPHTSCAGYGPALVPALAG